MRKKLISMAGLSILASSVILSGCGGKRSETPGKAEVTTIEYAFWGDQNEINTILATIDDFNQSHETIQVMGIGMDSSVYLQKLSAYASSNTMPDIVQVALDYGDIYNQKGLFEPLDSMIESSGIKDKVNGNIWDGYSYEGSIYAVPLQASANMLFGNKNLFAEAGIEFPTESWTEEEFREAAIKMTNSEKNQYGIIWGEAPESWTRALYGNNNTEIYDRNNKKMNAVGNEALAHAIDLMVIDLMQENKAAPPVLNGKDIGGGFETGKYGMAAVGFWDIKNMHEVIQDSFDWDIIPLPINEKYGQWSTRIFSNALSISKDSEKKEAAFEYIKWTLENREVQTQSVALPVNKEIAEDPAFMTEFEEGSKKYNKKLAFEALNNGCTWQNTGTVAEINTNVINPEIERLILKPESTSLEEVLENIQINGQKVFDAEK